MLIPRRVKYRKQHRPGRKGQATGGTRVSFGEYGIQALSPAYVTNRQIEAARIAMTYGVSVLTVFAICFIILYYYRKKQEKQI